MRHIRFISIILVSCLLLLIIRCNPNHSGEPTEEELQISKLAKQWQPSGGQFVLLDNKDVSSAFQNFTLSFDSKKGFSTTQGNSSVWPASGTYEFDQINDIPDLNRLIRSDGVFINIIKLTDENLKITFYYNGSLAGGRITGLSGEYIFDLVAQ